MLSQDEPCRVVVPEPYPKTLSQREPTQAAAAEVLPWQVSPSGERITSYQVATIFMVPCQYGFDVWGLGGVLDLVSVGLKLHRTIEEAA